METEIEKLQEGHDELVCRLKEKESEIRGLKDDKDSLDLVTKFRFVFFPSYYCVVSFVSSS